MVISTLQIKASQIYCWDDKRDKLELLQADKVYPPSVTLTLEVSESRPFLVRFNGSTADDDMDVEIMLPLGLSHMQHCAIIILKFFQ